MPKPEFASDAGAASAEIERWTRMSAEERAQVMAELPARLATRRKAQRYPDDRMTP